MILCNISTCEIFQNQLNIITYGISACFDTFSEFVGTLSYDGELMYSATSKEECEAACLDDPECLAFDHNVERNTCYMHYDGYLNNVVSQSGVNQYRRQDCTAATDKPETIHPGLHLFIKTIFKIP